MSFIRISIAAAALTAATGPGQISNSIPHAQAAALDGHRVDLPQNLSKATVVIVGFTRNSADRTTAWEIPVRTKLADADISFYDIAVLASVPGFLHGWVLHAIKGKVPADLHDRFLPVFSDEEAWKQVCRYDPKSPDDACVMLVDRNGKVIWQTYASFSNAKFLEMCAEARRLVRDVQ